VYHNSLKLDQKIHVIIKDSIIPQGQDESESLNKVASLLREVRKKISPFEFYSQ
jgi:hypothetical protein